MECRTWFGIVSVCCDLKFCFGILEVWIKDARSGLVFVIVSVYFKAALTINI